MPTATKRDREARARASPPARPASVPRFDTQARRFATRFRLAVAQTAGAVPDDGGNPRLIVWPVALINLAQLFQDINCFAEAEPLMGRALSIVLDFTRRPDHEHPRLHTAIENYASILTVQGRSEEDIGAELRKLFEEHGLTERTS